MKTNSDTTTKFYIGLDVHKEQTAVAIAEPDITSEIRSYGNCATSQIALERLIRRIAKARQCSLSELHICYEAGGCGMWIARLFVRLKVQCTVVAPSLIPSMPGDQVKTDKKDAIKLARHLRSGDLTAVHIPDEIDESIRDLCRARVDTNDDLRRCKNRLLAMLRRLGFNYDGKTHWTEAHKRYLRNLRLPHQAHRIIMEEFIGQIDHLEARISRIENHMELLCEKWHAKPIVHAMMTLRGFARIASMMVVSEIGDFIRFTHPKQLMKYLGLTPTEYTSAKRTKQGAISKCGNAHLRWLMVECATHYRNQPRISSALSIRQQGQPAWLKEISWKAQNRLHARFTKLRQRLMNHNKIKVAVARELTGVIWEIGVRMQASTQP